MAAGSRHSDKFLFFFLFFAGFGDDAVDERRSGVFLQGDGIGHADDAFNADPDHAFVSASDATAFGIEIELAHEEDLAGLGGIEALALLTVADGGRDLPDIDASSGAEGEAIVDGNSLATDADVSFNAEASGDEIFVDICADNAATAQGIAVGGDDRLAEIVALKEGEIDLVFGRAILILVLRLENGSNGEREGGEGTGTDEFDHPRKLAGT